MSARLAWTIRHVDTARERLRWTAERAAPRDRAWSLATRDELGAIAFHLRLRPERAATAVAEAARLLEAVEPMIDELVIKLLDELVELGTITHTNTTED